MNACVLVQGPCSMDSTGMDSDQSRAGLMFVGAAADLQAAVMAEVAIQAELDQAEASLKAARKALSVARIELEQRLKRQLRADELCGRAPVTLK